MNLAAASTQRGISSDPRQSLDTQADYDALFETYEQTSLPNQGASLSKIQGWVAGGERVALTCFEHLPYQCHRHCVAEALASQFGKVVWLLIQNGKLLSGSVLFWDVPEANLNPLLMGELVQVIFELQRLGVQVFLATHNHVLLKEFDLRKEKGDAIRYISLFRHKSDDVVSRATDTYADIEPNPIGKALDSLYDREVERSLGPTK